MALVGPTASGKSALAMEVARALGDTEIVSVDSMQVYRGMDVGTAKPGPGDRAAVRHHLLDVADPAEDFSVARFQEAAVEAVADIEARGRRALLVGGSGLYLQAVVDGLTLPGEWPALRAELEAEAATPAGVGALHRRLASADPPAAARIVVSNGRRIVRALEVTIGSGRPFSSFGPGLGTYPATRFRLLGVWLPRALVARRIAERYRAQLGSGFLDEVRALAERPAGLSRTARQALGYRELLAHVGGETTLEGATDEAVRRTREFARRQRSWFRRDPRITWMATAENPLAVLPAVLGHWAWRGIGTGRAGMAGNGTGRAGMAGNGTGRAGMAGNGTGRADMAGNGTGRAGTVMRLEKYHGLGNDFLVLLDLAGRQPIDADLVRALCDRRRGVGADGLIRVTAPADGADVAMELRNADGSRAEMSGNGIRCLARALVDAGLVAGPRLTVGTDAGARSVTLEADGEVSVDMGDVAVGPELSRWADVFSGDGPANLVDVGNPHLVVRVADPARTDVVAEGRSVERFHGPINVEFVAGGPGPDELTVRVWERGVGETSSCGTGAVAAAATARQWGLVGDRVTVHQPGGDLLVDLEGDTAVLRGPAEHVCTVEVACR